jgi:predicted DNA-binding protein (UPF0251 family)
MKKGRRKKIRYIQKMPQIAQFSPRGKPGRPDEVELTIDQYEAIKLADFQGYDQTDGAVAMGISRPSFGRILRQGRKVVAEAIVSGKIIRIRIGNVQVGVRHSNFPHKGEVLKSQKNEEEIRNKILRYSKPQSKAT